MSCLRRPKAPRKQRYGLCPFDEPLPQQSAAESTRPATWRTGGGGGTHQPSYLQSQHHKDGRTSGSTGCPVPRVARARRNGLRVCLAACAFNRSPPPPPPRPITALLTALARSSRGSPPGGRSASTAAGAAPWSTPPRPPRLSPTRQAAATGATSARARRGATAAVYVAADVDAGHEQLPRQGVGVDQSHTSSALPHTGTQKNRTPTAITRLSAPSQISRLVAHTGKRAKRNTTHLPTPPRYPPLARTPADNLQREMTAKESGNSFPPTPTPR